MCFGVSAIARNRKPGPVACFFIAFFLTPLVGLAVALLAKKVVLPPEIPTDEAKNSETVEHIHDLKIIDESCINNELHTQSIDKNMHLAKVGYCSQCGRKIELDASFCDYCGKAISKGN